MLVQDIPRSLQKLQDPMERVVWHELGATFRKHYGADVGIQNLLTQLIGLTEYTTIALEGGADAAIIREPGWRRPDYFRREEIFIHCGGLGIQSREVLVRDPNLDAWIDDVATSWRGCIRTGGDYSYSLPRRTTMIARPIMIGIAPKKSEGEEVEFPSAPLTK